MRQLALVGLMLFVGVATSHAQPTGTLYLTTNLDSVYVVVNDDFQNFHRMGSSGRLELEAGTHRITFVTRVTYDLSFQVNILPGRVEEKTFDLSPSLVSDEAFRRNSAYPVLSTGKNLVVVTDADSEVYVDGVQVGVGTQVLRVESGTHHVETRHYAAGTASAQVTVQAHPPRMARVELYTKPKRSQVQRLAFVPGAAQVYKSQLVKGGLLATVVVGGLGVAAYEHTQATTFNRDYEEYKQRYEVAASEQDALLYGDLAEEYREKAVNGQTLRNVFLGAAVAAYLYNIFDGMRSPEGGFREETRAPNFSPMISPTSAGVSLRFRF